MAAIALWPTHGLGTANEDVVASTYITSTCLRTATNTVTPGTQQSPEESSRRNEAWLAGIEQLRSLQSFLTKYADEATPVLNFLSGEKPSTKKLGQPALAIRYRPNSIHQQPMNKHLARLNQALADISESIRKQAGSDAISPKEASRLRKEANLIDEWRTRWSMPWLEPSETDGAADAVDHRRAAVEQILPLTNWHTALKHEALNLASLVRRSDRPESYQSHAEKRAQLLATRSLTPEQLSTHAELAATGASP